MRKRVINKTSEDSADGLDLERLAQVEVTSEDEAHPVESALLPGHDTGWRAAEPGEQTIRILFDKPQRLRQIHLLFVEEEGARTQEFVLRGAKEGPPQEIARQQYTFSPAGATREVEDYTVDLEVSVLELSITPDIGGGHAHASLERLRLA